MSVLESQILWGVITFILAGMALYGKFSITASRTLLVIAWAVATYSLFRVIPFPSIVLRLLTTMLCASVLGIGLFYLDKAFGPEKNFCYFTLYKINDKPVIANGQFQLAMNSVGVVEKLNYWISPAGAEPTGKPNDPYYSIDVRKPLIEIVHEGGRAWDRALPVGEYRIDFNAKNGNWYEQLAIYVSNGEIKEHVKVTKSPNGGEVLLESQN